MLAHIAKFFSEKTTLGSSQRHLSMPKCRPAVEIPLFRTRQSIKIHRLYP